MKAASLSSRPSPLLLLLLLHPWEANHDCDDDVDEDFNDEDNDGLDNEGGFAADGADPPTRVRTS